jgi:hypothetical protein
MYTGPDTLAAADDGQWIMPGRNFASTRYSGLSEITADNVAQLELAWSFSTGASRGHEAAPLVVGSTMFVSFLGTALLFWWALLHGREGRLGRPAAVIYLFTTAGHTSLLGALLTFSPRLWYPLYDSTTAPWGLTPLEDQQLAGVIMWVPAGLSYLFAALGLAATWLRDPAARPAFQSSTLPERLV